MTADTLFGMRVIESNALEEGTILLVDERRIAACLRFDGPAIIQIESFPRDALMKIVLGPKPDWIKEGL